jgi:hypothetical protein
MNDEFDSQRAATRSVVLNFWSALMSVVDAAQVDDE